MTTDGNYADRTTGTLLAFADRYAADGYHVLAAYLRDQARAQEADARNGQ